VDSTRRISITTGALFVIATVAAIAAPAVGPALGGPAYLTGVAGQPDRLTAASLLYLIAAGSCAGIAIALYPLLKRVNAALALGAVVFRAIEAVFYTVAVVTLLSVLPLGQQLLTAPAGDRRAIHVIADTLLSVWDHSNLAAIFAFSLGALMYYALFYRSRLVPRWLSGWGVVAASLMLIAALLSLFSDSPVTGQALLILPIAVQEMVLAVWLLIKGFSPAALAASPEGTNVEAPTRSSQGAL
jgi:Domain of unknown function (DUF4386)